MILAEPEYIQEVRKMVLEWHQENDYPGYNHVEPVMEFYLNRGGFTMYESKEQQ